MRTFPSRGALVGALAIIVVGIAACSRFPNPFLYPGCGRHPVVPSNVDGTVPIIKELNRVFKKCARLPKCERGPRYRWGFFETKLLRDWSYPAPRWIWTGPAYAPSSVAEQDTIFLGAILQADFLTPIGKQLIGMTFFEEFHGSATGTDRLIGAQASYAACTDALPN